MRSYFLRSPGAGGRSWKKFGAALLIELEAETALEGDLVVAHGFREVHGVGRRRCRGRPRRPWSWNVRSGARRRRGQARRRSLVRPHPRGDRPALNHVLQFMNIPGPGVTEQGALGGGAKAGEYLPAQLALMRVAKASASRGMSSSGPEGRVMTSKARRSRRSSRKRPRAASVGRSLLVAAITNIRLQGHGCLRGAQILRNDSQDLLLNQRRGGRKLI